MGQVKKNSSKKIDLAGQSKENLTLLLDTIEGINRTVELKTLLAESMEATRLVMRSEASSLMLLDQDTGELFISLPTGPVKEDIKGKSIPKNKGVGGWVVENRKPYLTNNVEESSIFWKDLSSDFVTRNILCVPLISKENQVIGVLQAINRRKNADFTPHDIPVFQALATHVAYAIERSRQMEELHSRLKEKEVMITEIHHRIKNNLAAISGLIEIQMRELDSLEQADQLLRTTFTRLQSMMRVHDLLCEKGLFKDIELGLYLKQLTEKIQSTMGDDAQNIYINLKAENIHLVANRALLCGLVINELLVNIFKHGYKGRKSGEIMLDLHKEGDQIVVNITDDGIGLPEDFEINSGKSIGMWIIDAMLKKLEAEIKTYTHNEGSSFRIAFPLESRLES